MYKTKQYKNDTLLQGCIFEEMIGGPKSRSEQSEVEDIWGFWCSCKPPNGAGEEPRKFSDLCGS